jgi:hypothetical protein
MPFFRRWGSSDVYWESLQNKMNLLIRNFLKLCDAREIMRLYNYNTHFRLLDEEFQGFSCPIQLEILGIFDETILVGTFIINKVSWSYT